MLSSTRCFTLSTNQPALTATIMICPKTLPAAAVLGYCCPFAPASEASVEVHYVIAGETTYPDSLHSRTQIILRKNRPGRKGSTNQHKTGKISEALLHDVCWRSGGPTPIQFDNNLLPNAKKGVAFEQARPTITLSALKTKPSETWHDAQFYSRSHFLLPLHLS